MDHTYGGYLYDTIAAICGTPFTGSALIASLFLAGLAGGFTHCAGMCGPFVLAQVSDRLGRVGLAEFGILTRLRGGALVPYHLGRLTTYSALGAASGGLTNAFVRATAFQWTMSVFLLVAAVLFLGQLASPLLPQRPGRMSVGPLGRAVAALSRMSAPLFQDPRGWRGYAIGMLLGFLPCGLLYSAIAAAAASGDAILGGLGMAAFVAGTVPALFAVGYGGVMIGRRWREAMSRLARPLMALNAVMLIAVAVRGLL